MLGMFVVFALNSALSSSLKCCLKDSLSVSQVIKKYTAQIDRWAVERGEGEGVVGEGVGGSGREGEIEREGEAEVK